MLNYWRTTAGTGGATTFFAGSSTPNSRLAASPFSDYGFDGPFFDLVFTHHEAASETTETESSDDEEMREIDLDLAIDEQDFKISPLPSPSTNDAEDNSRFSHSLHKLLLKLKNIKPHSSNAVLEKGANSSSEKTVKLKGDEVKGPLISLFARDITISDSEAATHSAILGRETLQKYLNILKPLYVRVEKMKLAGAGADAGGGVSVSVSPPAAAMPYKTGVRSKNLQAGFNFKGVRKHLGKSRSISAASPPGNVGSNRRDDSLLEVQDGIQGAILHCKRSFNSSREGESPNYLGR